MWTLTCSVSGSLFHWCVVYEWVIKSKYHVHFSLSLKWAVLINKNDFSYVWLCANALASSIIQLIKSVEFTGHPKTIFLDLLLLLAAGYEQLTHPASVTVQPGHRLTIICQASYSVNDYYTAWTRKARWDGLETRFHLEYIKL